MPKEIETRIGLKEWDVIGRAMYPKASLYIVHIFAVICIFLTVKSFTGDSISVWGVYYILLAIVLEVFPHLAKHNRLKANRRFFEQEYGDKELVLKYTFSDDGYSIYNNLSGETSEYKYDSLVSYKETDEYLLLKSKDRQYFIIGKAEADAAGIKELLKEKAPELKSDAR